MNKTIVALKWQPLQSRCRWQILFASVMLLLLHAYAATAATPKKLNVLFIISDDMNNDLGCYGHPIVKSPHLDRLARRGLRFDRAYCQVPLCNPSRVSFLSGLRPDKTQVYTLPEGTRSHLGDWVMLPEYFRHQGYFTAGVGKIYHTGEGHVDPRSWDVEIPEFGKRPPVEEIIKWGKPIGPANHTTDWSWLKTEDKDTPDGFVARKAVQLMEQAVKEGKPFFLGAGFRRPHAPYAAPRKYFDLYPVDTIPPPLAVPAGYYGSMLKSAINYPAPAIPLTDLENRELIAAYYACNSFIDAQAGILLNALDRLDLWDNTIVVFFGDHGYHLGDHGGLWHKLTLFEQSDRVPLLIYAPGMKAGGKPCHQLVELVDLYPTLTALCGLPVPEGLDGINLAPLLDDPLHASKEAVYTLVARSDKPPFVHAKHRSYLGRSVRTDRWRYNEWDHGKRGKELYDHKHDPRELVNLAGKPEYAATEAKLHDLLQADKGQ